MNKDCQKMRDKMASHLFGALSRRDEDALTQHIAGCSECRKHMQALGDEQSLLRECAEKVDAGMGPREERMVEAVKRFNPRESTERIMPRRTIVPVRIAKLAVAATSLIAAGYFAGRFLAPPPVDIERLQAALEPIIRQSVAEQMSRDRDRALERHAVRLKKELARQLHDALNEFAAGTLAASRAATEQRLAELIRLIEAARTVDHYQVAVAFERIESNRLQDKTRFGEGLVRLTSHRNEMPGNKQ